MATEMRCRPFDLQERNFSNVEAHESAFYDSRQAA